MTTTEQKLTLPKPCNYCNGSGKAKSTLTMNEIRCMHCGGTGLRAKLKIPIATESAPAATDPVVEANRELLLQRSQRGIAKYGVTLAEANHSDATLLQHAIEEALDLANYLQALLQKGAPAAGAATEITMVSIDTPEFDVVLTRFYTTAYSFAGNTPNPISRAALIAHINQRMADHGAQQREAGRQDEAARILHLTHERDLALAAAKNEAQFADEQKQRAEKAETERDQLRQHALSAARAITAGGLYIAELETARDALLAASQKPPLPTDQKDRIRAIFLANGFTVKEGNDDLKPYVYAAAQALIDDALAQRAAGETNCEVVGGDANQGTINVRVDGRPNWSQFPLGGRAYLAVRAVGGVDVTTARRNMFSAYSKCFANSEMSPNQIADTLLAAAPAAHTTEATPVVSAQAPVVAAPVGDGDERALYTCIGKGGEYEFIGYSNGAGAKRGEVLAIYSDTREKGIFYHRTQADFDARMQPIDRAALTQQKGN